MWYIFPQLDDGGGSEAARRSAAMRRASSSRQITLQSLCPTGNDPRRRPGYHEESVTVLAQEPSGDMDRLPTVAGRSRSPP
jgi:hypothetical protein